MKKKKVLKIILFIVIGLIFILSIHFIRNYLIINKIIEKQREIVKSSNYSFITEHYSINDENDKELIEHYYKDGKNIMIRVKEPKNIIWYDEATKEIIVQTPSQLKATIDQSPFLLGNTMPNLLQEENKMYIVLTSIISNAEVNGKECYKLKSILGNLEEYFNKEDGTLLKLINGYKVIDEKDYDDITEYKNYKFNELKDEDISRPNLTGYEITKNN